MSVPCGSSTLPRADREGPPRVAPNSPAALDPLRSTPLVLPLRPATSMRTGKPPIQTCAAPFACLRSYVLCSHTDSARCAFYRWDNLDLDGEIGL